MFNFRDGGAKRWRKPNEFYLRYMREKRLSVVLLNSPLLWSGDSVI